MAGVALCTEILLWKLSVKEPWNVGNVSLLLLKPAHIGYIGPRLHLQAPSGSSGLRGAQTGFRIDFGSQGSLGLEISQVSGLRD